jgi:4-hydroxy-3-polyprenylbenzoate decarboxylase
MDVLDHSSSRFAFGSKMGIDATTKYPEEFAEIIAEKTVPDASDFENLIREIPVIRTMETSLLNKGISLLVLGIEKDANFFLPELAATLLKYEAIQRVKFIILVDAALPVQNLEAVVWYVTGNIDPKRDCKIYEPTHFNEVSHMIVDGTRKTAMSDGFSRDWPNPVLSSPETINLVDGRWSELGLGELIPSPSLVYYPLKRGVGAVSE